MVSVDKITGKATAVDGVTNANATSRREDQKQIAALRAKMPDLRNMRDMLLDVSKGVQSGNTRPARRTG